MHGNTFVMKIIISIGVVRLLEDVVMMSAWSRRIPLVRYTYKKTFPEDWRISVR